MESLYKRSWFCKADIYRAKGQLYLSRYVVERFNWLSTYIHQFHISDYPVPHDHPWSFLSIVLKGYYIEHFVDGTFEIRKAGSIRFRQAKEFHWIEVPAGMEGKVWTLFFGFKRKREWGFLTKDGWVDHVTYEERLKAQ